MMDVKKNKACCHEVNFINGNILTGEMLSLSSGYPVKLISEFFRDVDNCVLFGLDIDRECYDRDSEIVLCPGIIKYCGKLYLIDRNISVTRLYKEIEEDDKHQRKFLVFVASKKESKSQDAVVKHEMTLEFSDSCHGDGVCVGAINLIRKPELPEKLLEDPRDWDSDFSLLDVFYLSPNGLSYHPEIFRLVTKLLLEKESRDVYDNCLLMQLQSSKTVGMGVVTSYIGSKGIPVDDLNDRRGILCQLRKALQTSIEFVAGGPDGDFKKHKEEAPFEDDDDSCQI